MKTTKPELSKIDTAELVIDWNLWPRCDANNAKVDRQNVRRLKLAIQSGKPIPPIIADKKSLRITDGFHRHTAYTELGLKTVMVELRDYKNDAEMFLDSARINNEHGMGLTSQDIVHCTLRARRLGLTVAQISEAFNFDEDQVAMLEARTAATKGGDRLALPAGAGYLAKLNRPLTKQEEYVAKHSNATPPIGLAIQLLNHLKAGPSFDMTDRFVETLNELKAEIARVLGK